MSSTPYLRRLVGSDAECTVSPYTPHSWWHEFGRRAMVRRLEKRGFPQLWGWLFVTLTIDQDEFPGDDEASRQESAYLAGNDRLRRVVASLRKSHGIRRWFWKFELQENGWPHWHVGLDTREFVYNGDIADAWGLGFVKTKRVSRERDFRYMFKYVVKDNADVPEWLLNFPQRVRVFQTSVGFFGPPAKAEGCPSSRNRVSESVATGVVSLAQKFERWGRRVTVRFRDASFRPASFDLLDSVESYPSLFISHVTNGGRALDAYHIAVSLDSIPEIIKPWQPPKPRNLQPLKLYPSTILARFQTGRTSLDVSPSRLRSGLGKRTENLVPCL